MNTKIVACAMMAAVLLLVSGCGTKKTDVSEPVYSSDKPSINSFGVSQDPVPPKAPTPAPEPIPVPEVVSASSSPASTTPEISPAPAAATAQVEIKGFAFNPAELTVAVGTTVVWTNSDAISHDIKYASISSPLLTTGQTFEQKFTTPGTYDYSCGIHPSMSGKIIVK